MDENNNEIAKKAKGGCRRIFEMFVMCIIAFIVILIVVSVIGKMSRGYGKASNPEPSTKGYDVHITVE